MANCCAVLLSANRLLRDGIRQLLEKSAITVIAEGRDISELLEAAAKDDAAPLLAILHFAADHGLEWALECLHDLRQQFADAKLVVLADSGAKAMLPGLFRADVSAILLTEISSEMLERSVQLVLFDHRLYPADVMSAITSGIRQEQLSAGGETWEETDSNSAASPSLSKREHEVVRCLAVGLSNKTIARKLNITEGTVKVHVKGLLRKVKATNRTQLAIWALRQARPAIAGAAIETT